jgi:hypothetical protein
MKIDPWSSTTYPDYTRLSGEFGIVRILLSVTFYNFVTKTKKIKKLIDLFMVELL